MLAPSSHNSQPWKFRLTGDELPYSSTVVIDKFEEEPSPKFGRMVRIAATIDDLRLRLLDYELKNRGDLKVGLDGQIVTVDAFGMVLKPPAFLTDAAGTRFQNSGTYFTGVYSRYRRGKWGVDLYGLGLLEDVERAGPAAGAVDEHPVARPQLLDRHALLAPVPHARRPLGFVRG